MKGRAISKRGSSNPFDECEEETSVATAAIKNVFEQRIDKYDPIVVQPQENPSSDNISKLGRSSDANISLKYHKSHFADRWLFLTIICHFVQFVILLVVGYRALSRDTLLVLICIIASVPIMLIISRGLVKKSPLKWKYDDKHTPDDETDQISNTVIYILAIASILEGGAFAIYPTSTAGKDRSSLNKSGLYSFDSMVETLRFASITLYGFHRLMRPANRLDPLRTMLEVSVWHTHCTIILENTEDLLLILFQLEVVSVCWDAIDGSTLYQLLGETNVPPDIELAARVLVAF